MDVASSRVASGNRFRLLVVCADDADARARAPSQNFLGIAGHYTPLLAAAEETGNRSGVSRSPGPFSQFARQFATSNPLGRAPVITAIGRQRDWQQSCGNVSLRPCHAPRADRKEASMLLRWLTLGLSLLAFPICGCQNQGKAMGPSAINEICGYEVEAIERLGCVARTVQCSAPTNQKEFFRLTCLSQQKIVASRCATEQQAMADCLVKELESKADRQKAFTDVFQCATAKASARDYPPAVTPSDGTCPSAPADVNRLDADWPPALCALVQAESTSGVANPSLANCAYNPWNGDVMVQGNSVGSPSMSSICGAEIAALSTCSALPPAYAP